VANEQGRVTRHEAPGEYWVRQPTEIEKASIFAVLTEHYGWDPEQAPDRFYAIVDGYSLRDFCGIAALVLYGHGERPTCDVLTWEGTHWLLFPAEEEAR